MYIRIAMILSALVQLGASFIAISLIKRTKYNISWILISIGFFMMAIRRLYELILLIYDTSHFKGSLVSSWVAVITSVLLFIGTIYIKQIFNLQKRIDQLRKDNEARVLSAIIRTEEEARQKFAKELHDGIGPLLSAIKMSISAIRGDELTKSNKQIIESTGKTIDESISAVKEISNNLSPHILINYGLQKAVKNFTEHIITAEKLNIVFKSNLDNTRLDYNIEVILYRIICELVNNTIKHASANKIRINLFLKNGLLELLYSDNGIGFDPEDTTLPVLGMGFANIRSRVKSLNGNIEMYSEPGEGFNIKISVGV